MPSLRKNNNLAASLILRKKYKEAKKILVISLINNPNNPEVLVNLGSLYQLTSKPAMAIKYFQKCLKITQKYPQIYSKLLHQKMQICDWENIDKLTLLANKFDRYESAFTNVLRVDKPKINLITAQNAKPSTRI